MDLRRVMKWFWIILSWIWIIQGGGVESLVVHQGVFSHLTVQISPDVPQPANCQSLFRQIEELMNETSSQFFELTQRKGWIKSVDIVVPKNWSPKNCYNPGKEWIYKRIPTRDKTDIVIGNGARMIPWVEQFGDCGQSGSKVHVPLTFFQNLKGNLKRKSSILVKSFCKYQFGVFEEEGFLHDNLYPLTFVDGNKTVPNQGCSQRGNNSTHATLFCPVGAIYDRYAPTKQGLLCKGASAMEIILGHQNLQAVETQFSSYQHSTGVEKTYQPPQYDLIYPKRSRFVLILDRSQNMREKWPILYAAISEFLTMLPDNSEISIITFAKNAIMHLPPTVITGKNRNGIIGRLPKRTTTDTEICLFCAFNVTFKALQNFQGQIQPASVIFITGLSENPAYGNLEMLVKLFENSQIQFFSVSYPVSSTYLDISKIGKHFVVHENPSYLYTFSQLNQIFSGILTEVEHKFYSTLHIQLYENLKISGHFQLENHVEEFWISLLIENPDLLQYFELTSPSGQVKMFPNFMEGFVQFHIQSGMESGMWSYTAMFYPDLQSAPKTIVKIVTLDGVHDGSITLEAFPGQVWYHEYSSPKIYAKVTNSKGIPVLRANVLAVITGPDAKIPTKIQLMDNGNGLVDLTQNDGIYSAVFPYVAKQGFYAVQVIADDNSGQAVIPKDDQSIQSGPRCCGSRVEIKGTIPSPRFQRYVSSGSFFVNYSSNANLDTIPPSRIIDFRQLLSSAFTDYKFVTFEWSAPGNDLVYGKAAFYRIQCLTAAQDQVPINQASLPDPGVYGSRQSLTMEVPLTNTILLFSILGMDEASNQGSMSNIVSVFIYEPIYITTTTSTTTSTTTRRSTTIAPKSYFDLISNRDADKLNPRSISSVIISPKNAKNEMIDVSQHGSGVQTPSITEERVPFSSNIVEQFTVISDKVRPRSRARNPIYTEEAKIQIYAITGIISCMLLVVLFAATYIMIQKRKERRSRVLSRPHSVTRNPLNENIWNGSENMVRSSAWFDTLQKTLNNESFMNPMMTSFHIMNSDEHNKISVQSESTSDVHFHSKQTSFTDRTSLDSFEPEKHDEPDYENYPKKPEISVRRSKSMVQKPPRKSPEVHFCQPSLRSQTSAARKSTDTNLKRSLTFAHNERKYLPQARPLRHSNSRISEIIRQYNENNLQKSSSFQHDYESNDESVIAPPPPPLASGLEEGGGASVDSNEVSSLDEDWLLQKSLEKKRGCKRTSGLKKEMESDKASPEMIVQVDTKSAFEGYDFPNEPPKPAIPPRAPRPGTLNKRSYL